MENSLAWTVSTAAQTDCAPGQMSPGLVPGRVTSGSGDADLRLSQDLFVSKSSESFGAGANVGIPMAQVASSCAHSQHC